MKKHSYSKGEQNPSSSNRLSCKKEREVKNWINEKRVVSMCPLSVKENLSSQHVHLHKVLKVTEMHLAVPTDKMLSKS